MAILIGRKACCGQVNTMGWFQLREFSDSREIVSSNSLGGSIRNCGNVLWSVDIHAWGYLPPYLPNEFFTFTGALDSNNVTGAKRATGRVKCESVEINVPWMQNRGEDGYVYYIMRCKGAPTSGSDILTFDNTAVTDNTTPNPPCASLGWLEIDNTAISNVQWMKLLISAESPPILDSGVSGWYQHNVGNIDWAFSACVHFDDWTDIPAADSVKRIEMGVATNIAWSLNWGRFTNPLMVRAEPANVEPINTVILAKMTGFYNNSNGDITDTSNTKRWPGL